MYDVTPYEISGEIQEYNKQLELFMLQMKYNQQNTKPHEVDWKYVEQTMRQHQSFDNTLFELFKTMKKYTDKQKYLKMLVAFDKLPNVHQLQALMNI